MVDGRWSFVNTSGAEVVRPQFAAVEVFANGLARVRVDVGEAQRYGYVDRAGWYVWNPTD